jgi:hypothetical protein
VYSARPEMTDHVAQSRILRNVTAPAHYSLLSNYCDMNLFDRIVSEDYTGANDQIIVIYIFKTETSEMPNVGFVYPLNVSRGCTSFVKNRRSNSRISYEIAPPLR